MRAGVDGDGKEVGVAEAEAGCGGSWVVGGGGGASGIGESMRSSRAFCTRGLSCSPQRESWMFSSFTYTAQERRDQGSIGYRSMQSLNPRLI